MGKPSWEFFESGPLTLTWNVCVNMRMCVCALYLRQGLDHRIQQGSHSCRHLQQLQDCANVRKGNTFSEGIHDASVNCKLAARYTLIKSRISNATRTSRDPQYSHDPDDGGVDGQRSADFDLFQYDAHYRQKHNGKVELVPPDRSANMFWH